VYYFLTHNYELWGVATYHCVNINSHESQIHLVHYVRIKFSYLICIVCKVQSGSGDNATSALGFENDKVEEFLNDLDSNDNEKPVIKKMTNVMLTSVLAKSSCSTVADLSGIAQRLELPDFDATVSSFKAAYKILSRKIHEFYDVSFAMVEGLHRIFAVRSVLEGLYLKDEDEPYTTNVFLQTKIKIRICILDEFTQFISSQYMQYSLYTMKVKKASVERTLNDELSQIINEMEDDPTIRDLDKNPQLFQQFGRHDKESDHVLFNQRSKIYSFIAKFAFDKSRSTVLFNYQSDHVSQAVGNHRIPDKHHYLGIEKTTSLNDINLLSLVAEVIMRNLQTKAEDYTTLSTKQSYRNNCQLMKPLCQQVRIVMSYLVLASVNIPLMKEAISVFSPSFKFYLDQTNNEINILRTMAKIVEVTEHVVNEYKKSIGIGASIIYTTKIEQLLQMNLFQDILIVVKRVGHHPNICIDILDRLVINQDDVTKDSVLIELLQGWSVAMSLFLSRLAKEKKDVLERWKEHTIQICKGDDMKDTHIRHGRFGTTDFKKYTVDKNISFSFFVAQVQKNSFDFYDNLYETRKTRSAFEADVLPPNEQERNIEGEDLDLASTTNQMILLKRDHQSAIVNKHLVRSACRRTVRKRKTTNRRKYSTHLSKLLLFTNQSQSEKTRERR
jgi:hypothetical protein